MSTLFELHAASVRFGALTALRELSLAIHAGERIALVGANGCGKSTLLRLLHGLIAPTAGAIEHLPRSAQAMLFQRPWLLRASARSNVALGAWLRGQPWRTAAQAADAALMRVGLAELAPRNARTLSGGQQQRVALARAWALAPQALLLDEPTASLDPAARREVEALILDYARQPAVCVVFASHSLAQVRRLATRVIYLEAGRILADQPVQAFFEAALPAPARWFLEGELA